MVETFRANSCGFWETYRWLLLVFFVALLCDAASTIHFMLDIGPEPEVHPMVRIASRLAGPVVGPLLGAFVKAAAGVIVSIYCRRWAAYILIAVSLISLWAAWYNVWGVHSYSPWFMQWIP